MTKAKKSRRVAPVPVEQVGTDPVILNKGVCSKHRRWTFTFNNWTIDDKNMLIKFLEDECTMAIFGEEIGDETGTEHLQGYMEFKNTRHFDAIRNIFPWHIEIAKKVRQASVYYCSKQGKVWSKGLENEWTQPDPLLGIPKKDWQIELESILEGKPDPRKVYWYYDPVGGAGKSTWTTSWTIRHQDTISVDGKGTDIINALANKKESKSKPPRVVIWDFERERDPNKISYASMEKIKNGNVFNSKFKAENILFPPPHIVCFSNSMPVMNRLSQDRWVIKNLSEENYPIFNSPSAVCAPRASPLPGAP